MMTISKLSCSSLSCLIDQVNHAPLIDGNNIAAEIVNFDTKNSQISITISENSTLTSLDVSKCSFDQNSSNQLLELVSKSLRLYTLKVKECNIPQNNLISILKARSQSLTDLTFFKTELKEETKEVLAEMLKNNDSLLRLSFKGIRGMSSLRKSIRELPNHSIINFKPSTTKLKAHINIQREAHQNFILKVKLNQGLSIDDIKRNTPFHTNEGGDGQTAIHIAVEQSHCGIIYTMRRAALYCNRVFLTNIIDDEGRTPRKLARNDITRLVLTSTPPESPDNIREKLSQDPIKAHFTAHTEFMICESIQSSEDVQVFKNFYIMLVNSLNYEIQARLLLATEKISRREENDDLTRLSVHGSNILSGGLGMVPAAGPPLGAAASTTIYELKRQKEQNQTKNADRKNQRLRKIYENISTASMQGMDSDHFNMKLADQIVMFLQQQILLNKAATNAKLVQFITNEWVAYICKADREAGALEWEFLLWLYKKKVKRSNCVMESVRNLPTCQPIMTREFRGAGLGVLRNKRGRYERVNETDVQKYGFLLVPNEVVIKEFQAVLDQDDWDRSPLIRPLTQPSNESRSNWRQNLNGGIL